MSKRTLADVERELAAVDQQLTALQAEHDAVLRALATGDSSPELGQRYALVTGQLQALPMKKAGLQAERSALVNGRALAEYEQLQGERYALQMQIVAVDGEIAEAYKLIETLNQKRAALADQQAGVDRKARKIRAAVPDSKQDFVHLEAKYQHTAPDYPGYDRVMAGRARRGELPPGIVWPTEG